MVKRYVELDAVLGALRRFQERTSSVDRGCAVEHCIDAIRALPTQDGDGEVERLREERVRLLAFAYNLDYRATARYCDEVLDRSGRLLGEVREAARAALKTETE